MCVDTRLLLLFVLQERSVLVSFKGARHDLPVSHPAYPRNTLSRIHNGQDIIIATYCRFQTVECGTGRSTVMTTGRVDYVLGCTNDTVYSTSVDYSSLILQSQFTIVLPGEGSHSYRLLEAMSVCVYAACSA